MTAKRMKPEIKAKWFAALRSGEYDKGTGALNRDYKFCCLGVLCELAVKEGVIKPPKFYGLYARYGAASRGEWNETFLPPKVAKWAGIPPYKKGSVGDAQGRIADQNDKVGTFEEVIPLIESIL